MKELSIILSLTLALFLSIAVQAEDTDYQTGMTALKKGELNQALTSLQQAAVKNPHNKEYAQEFMILRQVIAIQSQLDRQPNVTNWNPTAQRLRTYYEQKGIDSLLLNLDQKIYAKHPTVNNAALLGESFVANDKADEAIALLSNLLQKTPLTQAVLGLAYLKDDDKEAASYIAASLADALMTNPLRLRLARIESGLGQKDKAIATLITLFEQTPPSQHIAIRELCKNATEFTSLQSDPAFIAAMQTSSKVTESACSGGSSCGTCPMRAQCPSAQ